VRFPFFTPFRVVGWGTLALINAGLAESKGRSRYPPPSSVLRILLPVLTALPAQTVLGWRIAWRGSSRDGLHCLYSFAQT
jgi:hypothetical protein